MQGHALTFLNHKQGRAMPYLAPVDLFRTLSTLTKDFLQKKGLTPSDLKKKSGSGTFYGHTDTTTRGEQLSLIDKLCNIDNPTQASNDAQKSVERYQFMIGVVLCIRRQIRKTYLRPATNYGTLHTMLTEQIRLTDENVMDAATKRTCLDQVIRANLIYLNGELANQKLPLISSEVLNELKKSAHEIMPTDDYSHNHPVASVCSKAGKAIWTPVGIAFGWVLFDMVGKSAITTPIKLLLTSAFSYTLGIVNPSYGPLLFAGRSAERAINITCQVSGAMLGREIAARLGEASGALAGLSIEIAYAATCRLIDKLKQLMNELADNKAITFNLNLLTGELTLLDSTGHQIDIKEILQQDQGYLDAIEDEDNSEELKNATVTILSLSSDELAKVFSVVEESRQKIWAQAQLSQTTLDNPEEERLIELTA